MGCEIVYDDYGQEVHLAEKRVKVPTTSGPVDAVEVAVNESTERWTEVKLEDGSVIRLRTSVIAAARIVDRWDPEGNPMYSLKINQIIVVANAPEHLRKGGGDSAEKGVQ
jgi:hypothetical protein